MMMMMMMMIIELYLTRVKYIDYWLPSSFYNGPPTIKVIKQNCEKKQTNKKTVYPS